MRVQRLSSHFTKSAARQRRRTRFLASERLEDRLALSNMPLGPIAVDDHYAVSEDAAIAANVLLGSDIAAKPGQGLRVAEVNGQAISDGTTVTLPSGATLSVAADGSFSYDPTAAAGLQALDSGEQSLDQFSYTASPQFSNVYVFGDSLSDQGQLFALTDGAFPPEPFYSQGRFSNGPIWIEDAAPRLGLTTSLANNFSVGGATTGTANYNEGTVAPDLPGVTDELNGYLQQLGGQAADPDALYVVWAGTNDFFLPFTDPVPVITQAVTNISTIVGTLEAVGAQHVLVMNMPDLGLTPYGLSDPVLGPQLTALTLAFNAALFGTLDAYGLPATQIDVFSRFQQIVADPITFGLTNVTVPVLNPFGIPVDPATSLFWDSVHPTAAGHALIADLVFEELSDEAVATIDVTGVTSTPVLHVQNLPGAAAGDLRLLLSATDSASNDQTAGLQYLVNWGDGSAPTSVTSSAAVELTHSFLPGAVARIRIEVVDQDGDSSGVLREAVLWGTNQADLIEVRQGQQGQTQLWRNNARLTTLLAGSVDRIVAFGLGGNDVLAAYHSTIAVEFDGGSGGDWLLGDQGDDLLRGGPGNDVLLGRGGDDSLMGGAGEDFLVGGAGDDLLDSGNETSRRTAAFWRWVKGRR